MGWWTDFKASREVESMRRDVARARSPFVIAQFIDRCVELGKMEVALEEANRGLQEFPNSESLTEAFKRMVRARCAEDLKVCRDEVRKTPGPKAYYKLACLYKEMRDLDQAVELARKGIELYPTFEGNYIVLADIRYERFQRDLRASDGMAAIALFEKAVDLNRENYRLLFQLAEIFQAIGARDMALDKVKMILSFAPDDRKALQLNEQLEQQKPSKVNDLKEILGDFERRASAGGVRKVGQLAQRYVKAPDQLARKLASLENNLPGFQRGIVLGPSGEMLAGYPGGPDENRRWGEVFKRMFNASVECSLRMDISTFEKGFFECRDGFTYLVMADRLQLAVLCSNKAKKEKILDEVFKFVEHDLYV
jgi:tetratricopeptide (TPR) repeat protein